MATFTLRIPMRILSLPGTLAVVLLLPLVGVPGGPSGALDAQERPPHVILRERLSASAQPGSSSGWLGMQIQELSVERPFAADTRTIWAIDRVVPDSPADEAGVRRGDRLLSVNGESASSEVLDRLTTELEPGENVRIRVERGDQRLEFDMTAARRPLMILDRPDGEYLVLHLDTLELEGGRLRLRSPSALRVEIDSLVRFADSTRVIRQFEAREVPFPALRGDSIRVRAFPNDSIWAGGFAFDSTRWRAIDSLMVRPFAFDSVRVRTQPGWSRWEAVVAEPRVPTVYWSGQRVVAGAHLIPINPGLAGYFEVDSGLLVVDVVDGSPADGAGIRAGDVIVEIDDEPVIDLAGFRARLDRAYRTPPVPLVVVREGRRTRLELTR